MNICNKTKEKSFTFISGHIYEAPIISEPCIYVEFVKSFIGLENGNCWSVLYSGDFGWIDVTDQYCLQKVK